MMKMNQKGLPSSGAAPFVFGGILRGHGPNS